MSDAAEQLFDSLDSYSRLDELVAAGEAEGMHLECRSPKQPLLNRDLQARLAQALSGFANTSGGVFIWGMSTTRHKHDKSDVLSQIEPIGKCRRLEQQIIRKIPALTTPPVLNTKSKILFKNAEDTKGVILTYIPHSLGDPVQAQDNMFYFRSGDEFIVAPYEMIKRLFAATDSPDLTLNLDNKLVRKNKDGSWKLPIVIMNRSSAVAEQTKLSVKIKNFEACESVSPYQLRDLSDLNPGEKVFGQGSEEMVIHRGLDIVCGHLTVKMKGRKRRLELEVLIFANKMRARSVKFSLVLSNTGLSVKKPQESYLY